MQDTSNNRHGKSRYPSGYLVVVFQLLLGAAVLYYLWEHLALRQGGLAGWRPDWPSGWRWVLPLPALGLAWLNWLLEARKWQVVAGQSLSAGKAWRGVVLGLTLDNVLPAGSGGLTGRLAQLPAGGRWQAVPGILAAQLMQTLVTLAFGLWGVSRVWGAWQPEIPAGWWLAALLPVLLLAYRWRAAITAFLQPLRQLNGHHWLVLLALSAGRYLVFSLQFVLLAAFFAPQIHPLTAFACAAWMFAARSFMPRISSLERLGIRTVAVVFFMDVLGLPYAGMLHAMLALWLVNLALPSLAGLYFLRDLRWRPARIS